MPEPRAETDRAAETARTIDSLQQMADRLALPDESGPLYDCPDCHNCGFVLVTCRRPRCLACPPAVHDEMHVLARCCLSCDRGAALEAGIWFRFLWEGDVSGKPRLRTDRIGKFRRAMEKLGPSAARVEAALARISARHKAENIQQEI